MNVADIMSLIAKGVALSTELGSLIPQIEENFSTVRGALSSDDEAALIAMIDRLHAETNANTAALLALRDPESVKVPDESEPVTTKAKK